ncbi:MAG: AAA family ATPase [Candidatus Hydrogenedentota bacterium]|nr:MAG: AAA family ATPase [Candidatus Hydrogenedentota bacterium]
MKKTGGLAKVRKEVVRFREETFKAIEGKLVGYEKPSEHIMTALLASGHVLITGLPGLGKTMMVKLFSSLWGLKFNRIQFTPDLLPSDITGTEILQEEKTGKGTTRKFVFQKGPIFANILLADEINRTPPKTQSALLQAMEEREVTVGGKHFALPDPFFVLATQNPIEMEGTYPLPEAQLDRFLFFLELTYPDEQAEQEIALMKPMGEKDFSKLKAVTGPNHINRWKEAVDEIPVPDSLLEAVVISVRNTRPETGCEAAKKYVEFGAGPRATQYVIRAARARALLLGENVVTEDHIREVFFPALKHRIILNYVGLAEKVNVEDVLSDALTL